MSTQQTPDIKAAEQFLAGHARVVDRRVFQRLFQGGAAAAGAGRRGGLPE